MSRRGFLPTFILTLVFSFSTYAAAPGEPLRLGCVIDAHPYLTISKTLSKPPSRPVEFEKFIVKMVAPDLSSDTEAVDSKAAEKPEAARPSDKSSIASKVNLSIPAQPLLSSSSMRLTLIDKTYLDAYTILQESNSCSLFFGGPRIATDALNSLYPRLETSLMESNIGISMIGPITSIIDDQTGASYRLFKKALVNLAGPFYRSANYHAQAFFHKIGRYPANTRAARVTMLLHELGHLLPGSDGRWLLLDDGGDQVQVDANTTTIMEQCSEQITSLSLKHN